MKVRSKHGAGRVVQLFPVQTSFNPAQRKLRQEEQDEGPALSEILRRKSGYRFCSPSQKKIFVVVVVF